MVKLSKIPHSDLDAVIAALQRLGVTAEQFKAIGANSQLAAKVAEMVKTFPEYEWGAPKNHLKVDLLRCWKEVAPGVKILTDDLSAFRPQLQVWISSANGDLLKRFDFDDSRWRQVADRVQVRSISPLGFEVRIYGPVDDSPENTPVSVLHFRPCTLPISLEELGIVTLGDLAHWTGPLLYIQGFRDEAISVIVRGLKEYGLSLREEYVVEA